MSTNLDRRTTLLALAGSVLAGCGGGDSGAPAPAAAAPLPPPPPPPPPPPRPPEVSSAAAVKWSNLATDAMLADTAAQPPGLSPMEQSRILAMAFLAGHDAVNSIRPVYQRYRVQTDQYAGLDVALAPFAYEAALCGVLRELLPGHAAVFDAELQRIFSSTTLTPSSDAIVLGRLCAQTILADRANDGSANAQGPYVPGARPGDYQPTPPVNAATFVNWGKVRPFVMTSGDQFRTPPPYDVASAAYAADFNEVKSLGASVGSTRSAEQSEIAKFWLESTPLSWQRIAATHYSEPAQLSIWSLGRSFAALQVAQADAYIASLESKYHHDFWRPITAIRAADIDGNLDTVADSAWEPFDPVTPPVPEYPSAHAAAATAGASVLAAFFAGDGSQYLSSTGTTVRRFVSPYYFPEDAPPGEDLWSQIAREIGLSRIYVGYHFRQAVDAGWHQGRSVASWVLASELQTL